MNKSESAIDAHVRLVRVIAEIRRQ